ncbi:MAG: hypothetical protein V4515_04580 [Chloroflexota bacterium]
MSYLGPAPALCTREDVAGALDVPASARQYAIIDRVIGTARTQVENLTHRARFYPELLTLAFDWPTRRASSSWRLWLDDNDLLSITSLTTGGQVLDPGDYRLAPAEYGAPYSAIELLVGTSARGWGGGESWQAAITVAGVWGVVDDVAPAGQLAASLSTTTGTQVLVSNAAAVGVGDLLTVGTERMIVTDRGQVDTGQNLGASVGALMSATSITVADGTALHLGEQLLIDAERMVVEDLAGNTAVVTRAAAGSVLAAHTSGADIYAPRSLTVVRGALGTTAATHASAAPVSRLAVPELLRQLGIAESLVALGREQSGYARTIGSGEGTRAAPAGDLRDLRADVVAAYGRKARFGVV